MDNPFKKPKPPEGDDGGAAPDVWHRTPAPQPLPNDEQFTPGRPPEHEPHPPEDDFWDNLLYESNDYKISHYRALAQQLANDNDCAVLLHFYALPHYQRMNGTMMAAIIPAEIQW